MESSQGPGFAIEGGGDFWMGRGTSAAPLHVAFSEPTEPPSTIHRAAVEAGGRDNGAPGLRRNTTPGIMQRSSLTRRNNVEAVFHGTASCQQRDAAKASSATCERADITIKGRPGAISLRPGQRAGMSPEEMRLDMGCDSLKAARRRSSQPRPRAS